MAIKVTVNPTPSPKIRYPRVCRHKTHPDIVVLFTSEQEGICLTPTTHSSFGYVSNSWDSEEAWEPVCITIDSTQVT